MNQVRLGHAIHHASTSAGRCATEIISAAGRSVVKRTEFRTLGHPAENLDFFIEPKTNEVYDFIRFAKHFDKDGNPSETLLKAKQERLEKWRTLQELAGII